MEKSERETFKILTYRFQKWFVILILIHIMGCLIGLIIFSIP